MPLPASGAISLNDVQTEFGGSNPIAISEYYGVGGSDVTPQPLGLSTSVFQVSGSNGAWTSRSVDISAYAGHTVRIVFLHTGMSGFRADLQIDQVGFGSDLNSFESTGDVSGWQTTSRSTSGYNSAVFYQLGTGTTTGRWNRDANGTGSSNTGLTTGAQGKYYLYTEVTSYFSSNYRYYLRGPQVVVPAGAVLSFSEARYGSNMGLLQVGLDVISQPSATGAPASGQIRLSDFYGLAGSQTATATMTPAYDGSLESVYTYLTHDRRGFGVAGKNDFYFPESVGTTYDDGFGTLTNTSGLIAGAGVTSISAIDVANSSGDHILLQAQGASLIKTSISSLKISGFYPVTGTNTSATLTISDSRCSFGTPSRLTNNGITNMYQWLWLNSTTVPEGSINTAVSIIHHATANNLNVTIEIT